MGTTVYTLCFLCFLFIPVRLEEAVHLYESDNTANFFANVELNISEWYRLTDYDRSVLIRADNDSSTQQNCTERSIHEFPNDLFTKAQRQQGAILLHLFFGVYCFIAVALVCNDYFLPSIDCICTDLKISQDVAAATFMAIATSAPELFVNVVGTFVTESDLGVGAVIGSAVFNTFGVVACGGLSASKALQLDWWPLSRDSIIYSLSVGLLAMIMWDSEIYWYEAMVLIILYFVYFGVMFSNRILARWANNFVSLFTGDKKLSVGKVEEDNDDMMNGTYRPYFHGELVVEYRNSLTITSNLKAAANGEVITKKDTEEIEQPEEYVQPDTPFTSPSGNTVEKMWWLFLWPLRFLQFITIPDCRFKRLRNWYPITFTMCTAWIACTSYLVSWMMTVVGDSLNVSDSVMGLTLLAFGGSMPEAVSCIIMARQGNGAMGVSNSLGANTLDILLCLGLPWLIKTSLSGGTVTINSSALNYSCVSLLVCVIGMYAVIAASGFRLNKKVGVSCLFMYAVFLVFAILLESNVFFFVNWPMCDE